MDQKEGNMDSAAPAVGKDGDDDDDVNNGILD